MPAPVLLRKAEVRHMDKCILAGVRGEGNQVACLHLLQEMMNTRV